MRDRRCTRCSGTSRTAASRWCSSHNGRRWRDHELHLRRIGGRPDRSVVCDHSYRWTRCGTGDVQGVQGQAGQLHQGGAQAITAGDGEIMNYISNIARSEGDPKVVRSGPSSLSGADRLAKGLGWFSLVLGAAELIAPQRITRALGMEGKEALVRAYGAREIASGMLSLSPD